MHLVYTPLILLPLFAMLMALFLTRFGWRYRTTNLGKTFLVLMLALTWWSFAVVMEHLSLDLLAKVFWMKMSYFGITAIPIVWLIFTLQYTDRVKWLTRRNMAILIILPVITLVVVWTNGIHHLMWKDIWLDTNLSPPVDAVTHNIWFWIYATYAYALLLLGTLCLWSCFWRSEGIYRKQTGILLLAALVPWVGNILFIAGVGPFSEVDPTPLTFAITSLAFYWGLSHLQLIDITPVAYDAILKNMADGVIVLDTKQRIVELNPAAQNMIGRKRTEVIGQLYKAVLPGQLGLLELKTDISETRVAISPGENQQQRIYKVFVTTANIQQDIGGHLVMLHDETQQVKAEAALKERAALEIELNELTRGEVKYRELAASISDVFFAMDKELKYTYWNKASEKLTGIPSEEALGKHFSQTFPDNEKTRELLDIFIEVIKTKQLQNVVIGYPGNQNIIHEIAAYPANDGISVFIKDITERKQAEQALKASEQNFRNSMDSASMGIRIVDIEAQTLYLNQAFLDIFGYENIDEVNASSPEEHYTPEEYDSYVLRKDRILHDEPIPDKLEIDIVRKDGTFRHLQVFREEVFWDGKTQYQIIYNDITERKQAEQLYHTLADNSPVGIYIIQNRKFVFANIALQQVGGFTADELLDIEPVILVHPEDRDGVRQSAVQMLKGERLQPYEFRFITKSGETKWGLERTTSITYHGTRAILGNFMDITERKQTEEEIRRSNDTQTAVNALLKIALDGFSLEETLKRSIALVLSIPWLTFESRGSIFLVEDDPQVLVMKAQNGLAQQIQRACTRVPFGRCLCGQAALKREIQFANSLNERHETSYDGINPHGHYCVPILSVDKVLGVLNIYVKEGHRYDKREEVFLNAIADALAGVIERKQVEEALKASEEKYSTLIEESSDGIVILKDRLVVFANHMMCEMSGYSPDGILGKSFHELVPPEYRVMLAERERRELAEEFVSEREELEIIAKDGKRILIESRLINIVYKGGPAGMVIIHDITERKEVEGKLQQAAREWRTTFDSITDLISIQDKDNRIVRVNKAVADLLKTTPQELVGKFCREVMRGDQECPANCPHLRALKTGKPSSLEMFNSNLGIHFQESASPLFNEKGEITGTVLVARDVTQQKRMEEQLVMTDRLASIGELSSGIAHELNNPLTSVIGFSQLLMEGDVPENIKEDLGTVYSEAQRAAAIVKNLLTFARKHAPVKQFSQVNTVIEDVLRLRAYEQKVNNIEIENHLDPNLPEIMIDNFQMQQVFLNIMVNAEFAMLEAHHKGRLTITTEKIDGMIRVSIADDGPGISQENLKHIFDPFFTTKEVGKGTGLGLSICHGIVTEHGGQIYATSENGQGATFVVELPLINEQ